MTNEEFKKLAGQLILKAPAAQSAIDECESKLHIKLPQDYVDFLLRSNGADGPIGETGYVSLWPIEDIPELNKGYRIEEFAPGLLIFGSDGGGEAFAFDLRDPSLSIVGVPFVGMSIDEAKPVASTFTEMLTSIW